MSGGPGMSLGCARDGNATSSARLWNSRENWNIAMPQNDYST